MRYFISKAIGLEAWIHIEPNAADAVCIRECIGKTFNAISPTS